ncbi:MAG: hypothetical protein ACPF8V_11625, partial [Luteibaculum sp.]
METNQEFTEQKSIALIERMISEARRSFSKTAIFFLIWGLVLALAGIGEYVLNIRSYQHPYIVWPIASVVGAIWAGVVGKNLSIEKGNSTIIDRVMFSLWTSFFITLVLFIAACVFSNINPGSYIIIITGLPTVVTGMVLRFNPLIWG